MKTIDLMSIGTASATAMGAAICAALAAGSLLAGPSALSAAAGAPVPGVERRAAAAGTPAVEHHAAATTAPAVERRAAAAKAEWPGWRGPSHDGTSTVPGAFEIGERDGLRVAWTRPLGMGYSSISVVQGHAVTMFGDGTSDFVVSLDPATGQEQWRHRLGETFKAPIQSNDGPVSTPAIARGLVLALGPRGLLVALDAKTGRRVWSHDLVTGYGAPLPYFGFAASPAIAGSLVCVQVSAPKGTVLAFEIESGKLAWAAGSDSSTYQSPIVATLAGTRQVVFAGDRLLHGVDPENGEVLWTQEHGIRADQEAIKAIVLGPGDLNPITPVPVGEDGVLLVNYYGANAVLYRVRKDAASGALAAREAWRNKNLRKSYSVPIALDGRIFGYTGAFAVALDAETGETAWKSRGPGDGWIIAADGHLIYLSKDEGTLRVARPAGDNYQEIASVEALAQVSWTPPSYALGRVFVRNFHEIAAVEVAPGAKPTLTSNESNESNETSAAGATATSSPFEAFLAKLRQAPKPDRQAMVDAFVRVQKSFPIVEHDRRVHIVYRGNPRDVAVEGDMLEVGEQAAMTRVDGTDFHYVSFTLEPDARVDYQISTDFKASYAIDALNPRTVKVPGGEFSEIVMPKWTPPPFASAPATIAHGTLEKLPFDSHATGKTRDLGVYLPPGYAASGNRYPVLYVADGKNAAEFGALTATLDTLIAANRIRPLVAVLLDSSRTTELSGKDREKHAEMLVREIVPRIDGDYRTIADPAARAVMGADAAGFAAVFAAFRYPGTFGQVAGQSTFLLGPAVGDDLRKLVEASPKIDTRFFFGWGTYDMRGRGVQRREGMMDWRKDGQDFAALLQSKHYDVQTFENHEAWGYSSWRNYTHRILEAFFPPRAS